MRFGLFLLLCAVGCVVVPARRTVVVERRPAARKEVVVIKERVKSDSRHANQVVCRGRIRHILCRRTLLSLSWRGVVSCGFLSWAVGADKVSAAGVFDGSAHASTLPHHHPLHGALSGSCI